MFAKPRLGGRRRSKILTLLQHLQNGPAIRRPAAYPNEASPLDFFYSRLLADVILPENSNLQIVSGPEKLMRHFYEEVRINFCSTVAIRNEVHNLPIYNHHWMIAIFFFGQDLDFELNSLT